MFPFISITKEELAASALVSMDTPCEYAFNVQTNEFLLKDSKMYYVYGKEALRIWIYKALRTSRGRYWAYSWNFGNDLESLIGGGYSRAAMEIEAQRMVGEALTKNSHIKGIKDFAVEFEDIFMHIYFEAVTDQGNVEINLNL